MAAPRIFTPENRLAKILQTLDGCTRSELIAEAEARVAALRGPIRAFVAEKLQEVLAFCSYSEDLLFAECRTLGDLTLDIAEVAGAGGMEAIGEVARGISAMVDSLLSDGVWHTDALRLHLDALVLLGQEGRSAAEDDVILERLRRMRRAIKVVE